MSIAKPPASGNAMKKYNPKADPATWSRCLEFMTKKKRFCNLPRLPGVDKCGVHHEGGQARVPCPVDPSHTVFAQQLAAHIKVCNATKIARVLEAKPYFSKDVNSGTVASAADGNGQIMAISDVKESAGTTAIVSKEVNAPKNGASATAANASADTQANQTIATPMDDISLLTKIEALYAQHCGGAGDGSLAHSTSTSTEENSATRVGNDSDDKARSNGGRNGGISLRFERAVELEMYLAASTSAEGALTRRAAHRHLLQQTSIIASLKRVGLLDPSACFVELGAGRGMLGLAVIAALNKNKPTSAASNQGKLVLVERYPVRNKADRDLRKLQEQGTSNTEDEDNGGGDEGGVSEMSSSNKRPRTDQSSNETAAVAARTASATAAATPAVPAPLPAVDGFARARVDIRDLNMSGLPHAKSKVVAVAKHLCGVATDLGLRALLTRNYGHAASRQKGSTQEGALPANTATAAASSATVSTANANNSHADSDAWPGRGWAKRKRNGNSGDPSSFSPASGAADVLGLHGVCIATCCHHCVKWEDYVARGFFQEELGLGVHDFERMRKWSGWATNPVDASSSSSSDAPSAAAASALARDEFTDGNRTSSPPSESVPAKDDGAPEAAPDSTAAAMAPTTARASNSATVGIGDNSTSAAKSVGAPAADSSSIHEGDNVSSQLGALGALAVKHDPIRRRAVGRACKRLLDLGRLHFLRSLGLEAELLHYCPPEITQENALLLAWNPRTTATNSTSDL